jgi:hypothetical protein
MSIIKRRRMWTIGLYCTMTIINLERIPLILKRSLHGGKS